MARHITILTAYCLSIVAGYLGSHYHIPLAWMLGPLLVAAAFSIFGAELKPSEIGRKIGQSTIGVAVGLNLSSPVLLELTRWLPIMVLAAITSVLMSCVAAVILARMARIDLPTAYFASLPGGLAEMGNIGLRMGARMEPIALVQTLRVALVVLIIPLTMIGLGSPDFTSPPTTEQLPLFLVPPMIIGGFSAAYLLSKVHLNNPYMIGSVIFTAPFVATASIWGKMPPTVFALAQLLIGFSVGCRFRRKMLAAMPRVTVVGIFCTLILIVLMGLAAILLTSMTPLTPMEAFLSTAPGGISEMATTAQILHLAVPTIVGFQIVRVLIVNGLASHSYVWLTRVGYIRVLQGLLDRKTRT